MKNTESLFYELWISFASLVQCYAAAALMATPEAGFETKSESELSWTIRVNHKQLTLAGSHGPQGSWRVEDRDGKQLSAGSISLNEQGMAAVDDGSFTEMDGAAEILAARIF